MEKSYTPIVGDAKPLDTAKRKPEIKERVLRKRKKLRRSQTLHRVTMTLLGPLWRSRKERICREEESLVSR